LNTTNFWAKLPSPFSMLAPMEDVTDIAFRHVVARAARPDPPERPSHPGDFRVPATRWRRRWSSCIVVTRSASARRTKLLPWSSVPPPPPPPHPPPPPPPPPPRHGRHGIKLTRRRADNITQQPAGSPRIDVLPAHQCQPPPLPPEACAARQVAPPQTDIDRDTPPPF